MKSEWKPIIDVWSTYNSPTSFSQYAYENILSLKSVLSLHDMDVVEYFEYGFKCNFWDVRQRVTQSLNVTPLFKEMNGIPLFKWSMAYAY